MLITKVSALTGKENTREIAVAPARYEDWRMGRLGLIQHVFPDLSIDDLEFMINGTTPEEWDEFMGDEN